MAQKTKSAVRPSAAKVKPVAKKPAVKTKAAPPPTAKMKVAVKAKAVVKPAAVAKAPKAAARPLIEKAKAALKKESVSAAATPVAVAAPVATPAAAKPELKRARKISIDINPNEAASALVAKWTTLYKKAEQIEAKPYNMKAIFEEKTAIVHKVLGWGYILANRNDRLEVLFKDGIKYLISNYKPG
jgi:hypothetical protein